ncbi:MULTISPECIES: prepilin peptidase [unclassified Leifsonia]|uniref:prepilin peptidase n=1 Tax=unclassified Leifsonia TaxID=2663824 RepID=UPI0007021E2A|nr:MULTISPECIES: A24 family peptidase [unclassified Leifsonia]KQX07957.1 peptidase A24 [Leifsonia sp. Root1293]KRA12238.1 peptidase A24 [Leifsonia sp. Root60]
MVVVVGIFGSLIGSFLNVVVYRVPRRMSVVAPPSACPSCGTHITARDNVPVLSWLFLRGKCRTCAAAISARYPLVELGTALFFAVVALVFVPPLFVATDGQQIAADALILVAYLYLAAISVALALIDFDTHTLPNRIVLPGYPVLAVLFTASAALGGAWDALLGAGVGLLIVGGTYLLLGLIAPRGMGGGDVKLSGVIGMALGWLGWGPLIVGSLSAFILGGLFGLALILLRKADRTSGIPFGPWMLLGAWIGILAGEPLWNGYLAIFGLAGTL